MMHADLCADCLLWEPSGYVVLVERANEPFKGQLAIPGGFLEDGETFKLAEETGVKLDGVFSRPAVADEPNRDPRGRVISVGFLAAVHTQVPVEGRDDARRALWVPIDEANEMALAFDHNSLVLRLLLTHNGNLPFSEVL